MRTGTRCTTLVKLPVALSGGISENCAPDAGAIDFDDARHHLRRRGVDGDVDLLARADVAELRLLEIGVDIDAVERNQRHQAHAGLRILTELDRLVADDAVEGGADFGEGEIALGLLLRGDEFGAHPLRLDSLRLQHVEIGLGAGERASRGGFAAFGAGERGHRAGAVGGRLFETLLRAEIGRRRASASAGIPARRADGRPRRSLLRLGEPTCASACEITACWASIWRPMRAIVASWVSILALAASTASW